eukprot:g1405.t1
MSRRNPEDKEWKHMLRAVRTKLETLKSKIPGTFRVSGPAWIAEISIMLKDRPVADMVKNLEEAIDYGVELGCLPIDVLVSKLFLSRLQNNVGGVKETMYEFEKLGHKLRQKHAECILQDMESPAWVPIDLDFVPNGQLSPNEIKLADIEKQILDARAEAKAAAAAADRNRVQAARASVKTLKQEKKRLEAAIEEDKNNKQSTRNNMAVEVEELQRKISLAQAKATEAEENDDEEAEEAAYEEMDKLLAQLETLKQGNKTPTSKPETSKTKQRLEEAKHIDAEVSSLEDLRNK